MVGHCPAGNGGADPGQAHRLGKGEEAGRRRKEPEERRKWQEEGQQQKEKEMKKTFWPKNE